VLFDVGGGGRAPPGWGAGPPRASRDPPPLAAPHCSVN